MCMCMFVSCGHWGNGWWLQLLQVRERGKDDGMIHAIICLFMSDTRVWGVMRNDSVLRMPDP